MPPASEKVYANLGCGPYDPRYSPRFFQGWREIRVDIEPSVGPDIVADITDLSPIATDSLDGVWSSHCVEHLYQHQLVPAVSEIRRVLAPEGVACILVPDLQALASVIAADKMHEPVYHSPAGPITPHDMVFGFGREIARGLTHMAHRCGFTPSLMMSVLSAAGFSDYLVMRRPNFELAAIAHKTQWRSAGEREATMQLLNS